MSRMGRNNLSESSRNEINLTTADSDPSLDLSLKDTDVSTCLNCATINSNLQSSYTIGNGERLTNLGDGNTNGFSNHLVEEAVETGVDIARDNLCCNLLKCAKIEDNVEDNCEALNHIESDRNGDDDIVVDGEVYQSSTGQPSIDSSVPLIKLIDSHSNNPEHLTRLSISSQKLSKLELDLSRFVNVTVIDLSDNELTDLPQSFCSFKKCVKLNLSKNKLDKVPFCLYKDLYFIRDLDLSYNCIKEFNFSPVCIPYLSSLNVSHNELTMPPWWLLHDIPSCLARLDLSFNPCFVAKLPPAFLCIEKTHNYICSNITELDLSDTGLGMWNLDFLKKFVCLKKLRINSMGINYRNEECFSNSLDELPEDLLKEMSLEELEIENVQLSSLPKSIDRLSHLTSISMSRNHLSWLPDNFVQLECLKVLNASHCHLIYLPREMHLLSSLVELWLSFNDISSLPDLSGCKELKILDLYNNSFSQLPATLARLKLDSLDISANYFSPTLYEQCCDGSSYDSLKTRLRQRLAPNSSRSDSVRIEQNYSHSTVSGSCSYKSSWSSYRSSCSRKSRLSRSCDSRRGSPMKQCDEVWDIDPDDAWDPELYENMRQWTSEDSLSRCRSFATYAHRDDYFCPYQEQPSFKQNLYFVFSGEEENGQFDDA